MRFVDKLLAKVTDKAVDSFLGWTFDKLWPFAFGAAMSAVTLLWGHLLSIPLHWKYAIAASFFTVAAVFGVSYVCFWYARRKYMDRRLPEIQRHMLMTIGKHSGGSLVYQDVLREMGVPDEGQDKANRERRKLEHLGLLEYNEGLVNLTERGLRWYDDPSRHED